MSIVVDIKLEIVVFGIGVIIGAFIQRELSKRTRIPLSRIIEEEVVRNNFENISKMESEFFKLSKDIEEEYEKVFNSLKNISDIENYKGE